MEINKKREMFRKIFENENKKDTINDLVSEIDSLERKIKNLQEENRKLKETNEYHRELNGRLFESNKQLKNLCNEYEEEHTGVFEYWKGLFENWYCLKEALKKVYEDTMKENNKTKNINAMPRPYIFVDKIINSMETLEKELNDKFDDRSN